MTIEWHDPTVTAPPLHVEILLSDGDGTVRMGEVFSSRVNGKHLIISSLDFGDTVCRVHWPDDMRLAYWAWISPPPNSEERSK